MRFEGLGVTAARPVAERRGREVTREDGFQHDARRLLRHPVSHGGDAQRPASAIWFGDVPAPGGRRAVGACTEVRLELGEHPLYPIGLHFGQGEAIHPSSASVGPDPLPRLGQDVIPTDAVIEGVEAPARGLLGRSP
jgi:hypothetical protein